MLPLLLLIVCFAVYWPSLKGHLVGDDIQIIANPHLQKKELKWTSYADRQLSWLSFIKDVHFSSLDAIAHQKPPYQFHISNILYHWACSCMVALILSAIGVSPWGAFLFAVHPLSCGTVAYITGRFSLVSTLFGLLAVWGVLIHQPFVFLVGWLVACLGKPDMIVLPMLASILGGWYYLLAFLVLVPKWRVWKKHGLNQYDATSDKHGSDRSLGRWEFLATYLVETLKWFPMWLVGLRLRVMPDVPKRLNWKLLLGTATMFLLLSCLVLLPMSQFKVGLSLLLMSPWIFYSLIPLPHVVLEYRAYMNIVGMVILLLMFPIWVWLILSVVFAIMTWRRSHIWNNHISLWGTAYNEGSRSAYVLLHLGSAFGAYGKLEEAEYFLLEGLRQQPTNKMGLMNLQAVTGMKMRAKNEQI